jgi:signal transduction histidine kinase
VTGNNLIWIFFVYGLAFFSMGLAILLEIGHGSDRRLAHALRYLAAFGLMHGLHEWVEMFDLLGMLPLHANSPLLWDALRVAFLAASFLPLAAFGASLLLPEPSRRFHWLAPLGLAGLWALGMLVFRGRFADPATYWSVGDVWTRYVLAVPGALLASAGLLAQQRSFRQAGMAQFGRDSLWAAIAFAWYGAIGQVFTRVSPLPPSNVIHQVWFFETFGFPIQLLRATAAVVVAIFVIRFLRSSEVELQRHIAALQSGRLEEAQRRQTLRGELLKRVVAAQEAERQRIARELHDATGQTLTALGMGLRAAITSLMQDPRKASEILRKQEDLVAASLDELQRVIADLRPSHLDDLGLPATLRWYTGEVQRRASLSVSFELIGEERTLPGEVVTTLFRIAQEALTNVVKHGCAERASVRLTYLPQAVLLSVEDDGQGFEVERVLASASGSWGLLGMEERAALLGGRLVVHSRPKQGTQVWVNIPQEVPAEGANGHSTDVGR